MSGHHSFDKLRNRMTPERRAYNAAKTEELLAELSRCEAHAQSQVDLAKRLKVERQAIANMERRDAQTDERPQRESTT